MSAARIVVFSDIHYASAAEQARGNMELKMIRNPALRFVVRLYRNFIWLRNPLHQNHLLPRAIELAPSADLVVANGDFSCDSGFIGLSDDPARESARACLEMLRDKFGDKLVTTMGDHELGKFSLVGQQGGLRIESIERCRELGIEAFWNRQVGRFRLIGVSSSLLAFPAFQSEALPEEKHQWEELREKHLDSLRFALASLQPDERVLLFCHDPTAFPFLWQEPAVKWRINQVERTIIGHLHTGLVFKMSRIFAGIPEINWMGNSVRKFSRALSKAAFWKPFKPVLCPSLSGSELLKDGGFLVLQLPEDSSSGVQIEAVSIPR
jgi:hypothetical protein